MSESDELVYVATGSGARTVYHTMECSQIPPESSRQEQPLAQAERRGLRECKRCQDAVDYRGNEQSQYAATLAELDPDITNE
jgi:methylphosphotriester-DNA--protein-cysteine methyltransferase